MSDPFIDKYQTNIELDNIDGDDGLTAVDAKKASLFSFTQKSDLGLIILGSIFSAIAACGSPVQTVIYGRIFQKLSDFYIYGYETPTDFIKDVAKYCVMIIVVGAARSVCTVLSISFWMKNGEKHQRRVRSQIFNKISKQTNIEWVENFKNINGEVSQLNRCIEELRCGNAECLGLIIQAGVGALALFIVAMVFSWSVTLVVLALTPVFALSSWICGRLAYKYGDKENTFTAKSSKIINWCILNPAVTRLFNAKDLEIINFKGVVDRCSKFNYRVENVVNFNIGVIKALSLLMFVQGFWFGITMIRLKKVAINEVFTAFSACLMLAAALGGITELVGEIFRAQSAIGKLKQFLELADGTSDSNTLNKTIPTWCNGKIEFKDVQFKYQGKQNIVLRNLNLQLKQNEFNFVIGKSGSGKSTLAQLIMGFYKVNSGKVLVDDVDVNELDKEWIHNNVSMISSNPVIFNMSLKENLGMSVLNNYRNVSEIPDNVIEEACDFALLTKLVNKMGDINKPISNLNLSGGEKQRIAIARAKLRDTPILIIDEGLSALDHNNRSIIFNKLKAWRQGKTTIFITHQLEQIDKRDFVVIIQDGAVKTQGYMEQLTQETLIKDARLSLNSTPSIFSNVSYDSDDESDGKGSLEEKRGSKIKDYNYLKNPMVLKAVDAVQIDSNEEIYPLSKILFYYLKSVRSKFLIVFGLFFATVYAVSNPLFSYLFSRLLDNMLDTSIGINASADLKKWSCIIIGIAIINGLSFYLSHFILAVSAERWVNQLRKSALTKINDQDLSFFTNSKLKASSINALLMNDTRDLRSMVYMFLAISMTLIILISLGSIFALVLGWRLALTGLAFVAIILACSVFYARILAKHETLYKDRVDEVEAINFEMVNGIKTIHSLNLKEYFFQEFDKKLTSLDKQASRRSLHTAFSLGVKDLIISVATGILMYYGMRLVSRRTYDRLQFLQVITLLTMTFATAGSLMDDLPDITRGQRCGTYIMKLLQMPASKVETGGELKPVKPSKDAVISFHNVDFNYVPSKQALRNVSFNVKEKDIFGVIGESGSGKSTVMNLITRLYGNYTGSVQLNQTEIGNVDIDFLREYVSIVPQNPTFFEGTIYDNLTYGLSKEKMINSDIERYLELCNISSFTNSLSDGLQTSIGSLTENSLISSGQLQRLAMVRAIIRQPKVLILDECTSNLDTQNFNLFKSLIVKLNQELGLTIIIISHSTELQGITTNSITLSHGKMINI